MKTETTNNFFSIFSCHEKYNRVCLISLSVLNLWTQKLIFCFVFKMNNIYFILIYLIDIMIIDLINLYWRNIVWNSKKYTVAKATTISLSLIHNIFSIHDIPLSFSLNQEWVFSNAKNHILYDPLTYKKDQCMCLLYID